MRVTGIDSSPDAIDVARANAERLGLDVELMIADLIVGGPYDLIVSNPPYVRESEWAGLAPEITLYEPQEAVLGGPDGLDIIRRSCPRRRRRWCAAALLGVEIGQGQSRAVEALFEKAGPAVDRDEARPGRHPARRHRPPLTRGRRPRLRARASGRAASRCSRPTRVYGIGCRPGDEAALHGCTS